jgi:hypothetical protein
VKFRSLPSALLLALVSVSAVAAEPAAEIAADVKRVSGTQWYGVYFRGGQKCGFARMSAGTTTLGKQKAYRFETSMNIRLRMGEVEQQITADQDRYYALDGALLRIESTMNSILGKARVVAVVKGDKLLVRSVAGKHPTVKELPRPEESLAAMLGTRRLVAEKRVGETTTFKMFEPMMLKTFTVEAKLARFEDRLIGGVKTRVGVIDVDYKDIAMSSTEYVTTDGEMLETTVSGMFTLRREPEKVAKDVKKAFDALRASTIPVKKPLGDPRRIEELTLRVAGIPKADLRVSDGMQTYAKAAEAGGYVVTIRRATPPKKSVTLPMKGLAKDVAAWLEPSSIAQSDAPAVIAATKKAVGNETDAWAAARALQLWVYKNVTKQGVAAMSNAVQVLEKKKGDCGEHTALFVAMCRAAGIPARQVIGVGYSRSMKAFGYHAWAEVWVGKWIAMDPTWGEDLADATHLKFSAGDVESVAAIGGLIGSLKIEVVGVKRKE